MRFRRLRLIYLPLLLIPTACHRATTTTAPSEQQSPAPTPIPFAVDLEGQLDRIDAESDPHSTDAIINDIGGTPDELVKYAVLEKNPGKYAGVHCAFFGTLEDFHEQDGVSYGRIRFGSQYGHMIYVKGRFTTPILAGQEVMVSGYLAGTYSYTSQANWHIAIPAFAARAIVGRREGERYSTLYRKTHGLR